MTPVGPLPLLEHPSLPRSHLLDALLPQVQSPHHVLVQHHDPAARDGPHGQLLVARRAQLSHEVDIEGQVEGFRDLKGHHHPTTRKPEDHGVPPARVAGEFLGETCSSLLAVLEQADGPSHLSPFCPRP